tara:strand:+ start:456 stop:656 length:201 start_codon:yes stop_codon:yes gene_type:complete
MERLITAREFAASARYSQVYVYQLIREGKIKVVRIGNGRTLRIPETELARYVGAGRGDGEGVKDSK